MEFGGEKGKAKREIGRVQMVRQAEGMKCVKIISRGLNKQ